MRPAPRTPPTPRLQVLLTAAFALLLGLSLSACAAPPPSDLAPPASDAHGQPLIAQPPLSDAAIGIPGEVDFSCRTDADCAVKNVGNCCGYYPACVNVDSPTFPEQVMAECARNEMMAVCGFRDISGCQCVEGRCQALHDGDGPVR